MKKDEYDKFEKGQIKDISIYVYRHKLRGFTGGLQFSR